MKLAFTGDICFGDMEKFTNNPFKNIIKELSKLNCVVNLEAPFLPKSYTEYPIKPKVCLAQYNETIKYLVQLNPFLVNIANNHINDYGNFGTNNTINQLESANLNYCGAGYSNQNHNLFVLKKEKIVFLSYVTRHTDESGSPLFNETDFMGPKEFSLELAKKQIAIYEDYKKIVLFHWGSEDIHYPLPEQRHIAKRLIDMGVDLIIGNHPHVIQSYEQYRGKWIFYCLGHLFFCHYLSHYKKDGEIHTFLDFHTKHRRVSIIPVFDITEQSVALNNIYTIAADNTFEPQFINKKVRYNLFLFKSKYLYSLFYMLYMAYRYLRKLPGRAYGRLKRQIAGRKLLKQY
jgi:poly-gamma-glutamate synthesis protein (capsule biosynthesis protein)